MTHQKIVFTGTSGAGKTTAIATLSDLPPVVTDARGTDMALDRAGTAAGLDFGTVDLGEGQQVQLFGTPGPLRFESLWRVIARDALGLVILIDNSRPEPLADLADCLEVYRDLLPDMNCVIGVGHSQRCPRPAIDDYCDLLARQGLLVPVFPVDVRRRDDVLALVDAVIAQAETRV